MRVVRPIAEIDNKHAESAFWALMCCIFLSIAIVAIAVMVVANVQSQGKTARVRARVEACQSYEQIDARTDCVRRVD